MSKTYKLNACKRVACKGTVEILENVCLNFSIGFNKNLSFRLQNVLRRKKNFTCLLTCCIKSNILILYYFFLQDQYIFCYKACLDVLRSLSANQKFQSLLIKYCYYPSCCYIVQVVSRTKWLGFEVRTGTYITASSKPQHMYI